MNDGQQQALKREFEASLDSLHAALVQKVDWTQHPRLWEWANAYKTPAQRKLDDAREFLKSRAEHHPEWQVCRG
jgi:hypothetical protein